MRARLANALTLLTSLVICGVAFELAVRAYFGVPILTLRDWRLANITDHGASQFDPVLGWVQTSNYVGVINTLNHGIRRNSDSDGQPEAGAILAVGDSFTAGSEVDDDETWPAGLERILGQRVLNGGVGGYGTDQIVLRAERLLPELRPTTLLIGILVPDVINRTRYAIFMRPKPWFEIVDDELIQHNSPVQLLSENTLDSPIRKALARSLTIHMAAQNLVPNWWFQDLLTGYERVLNNPEAVSCRLLARLKTQADDLNIRSVVVVQYGGWLFARGGPRPPLTGRVIDCARRVGYEVVDEYDSLRAIADGSVEGLKTHYVMAEDGSIFGHMSATGNALISKLVAAQLRHPAPAEAVAQEKGERTLLGGSGVNLLQPGPASIYSLAQSTLTTVPTSGKLRDADVYALSADPTPGEHYLARPWRGEHAGPHALSLYVRKADGLALRLQLHDDRGGAAIADFVPSIGLENLIQVGNADGIETAIENVGDGWLRLTLHATLSGAEGNVIVQLAQLDQSTDFEGNGEQLVFQGLMVEYGQTASAYCLPGDCPP